MLDRLKLFWKSMTSKEKFDCIVGIFTIFSVILVFITLMEMQKERNSAYMPEIVFETTPVVISWGDQNKFSKDLFKYIDEKNITPDIVSINTYNIGVGVAKNLNISFDDSFLISLINHLNEIDAKNSYEYRAKNNRGTITINSNHTVNFPLLYKIDKLYLLPNAEEVFKLDIPLQYMKLVYRIYEVSGGMDYDFPDMQLNLEFYDVQGKKYSKNVTLSIEKVLLFSDTDGNGYASFNIVMTYK